MESYLSKARSLDDLLTSKQLAEALHVSDRTVATWRGNGEGPPYYRPAGKNCLYRWGVVLEWLESKCATSTAQEAA